MNKIKKEDLQDPKTNKNQEDYKFSNLASEITFLRTYSQSKPNGDKETWSESVNRYFDYLHSRFGDINPDKLAKARKFVLEGKVMPSMRLLQYAGPLIDRFEPIVYNCSFLNVDCIESFSEVLYLCMLGVGVGYGVNKFCVDKLPTISYQKNTKPIDYTFDDSTEGWVKGYHFCLTLWFNGFDVNADTSRVRAKGAKIGNRGYSAGRESLDSLLETTKKFILGAQGRKLRPIEVYDILCFCSYYVSTSGPRRVAAISFSDRDDVEMRDAKKGKFWEENPQRSICNNSIRYVEKPTEKEFGEDWEALTEAGTGERGIFNISKLFEQFNGRRIFDLSNLPASNACGEILLLSCQFCNLSEAIARYNDTKEDLLEKIRVATWIGTWQSRFTNFDKTLLRPVWQENCVKERLLGVSVTGAMDNPLLQNLDNGDLLNELRDEAVRVNLEESRELGINQSAAVTCCKPSGTVSLVMNTSSGIHARFAEHYIRRIRFNRFDTMLKQLEEVNIPNFVAPENPDQRYIEIPIKAPEGSVTIDGLSALKQADYWKHWKLHYTEHNPSFTCQVRDDEWKELGSWVYENFDCILGISFLPVSHLYPAAPIEKITAEVYNNMYEKIKSIDCSGLYKDGQKQEMIVGCDKSVY